MFFLDILLGCVRIKDRAKKSESAPRTKKALRMLVYTSQNLENCIETEKIVGIPNDLDFSRLIKKSLQDNPKMY